MHCGFLLLFQAAVWIGLLIADNPKPHWGSGSRQARQLTVLKQAKIPTGTAGLQGMCRSRQCVWVLDRKCSCMFQGVQFSWFVVCSGHVPLFCGYARASISSYGAEGVFASQT